MGFTDRREVKQYQFTAWPDHGVPEHPAPFLQFLRRISAVNPVDAGPVITHCSAGVGRTGAFIVVDSMLERIRHEKLVDVYGHVTCLRSQRNYMVQTEDQYIFIHDALLEAVVCGHTEVPARSLHHHIQQLMQTEHDNGTAMEAEFKKLASIQAGPEKFVSANLPCNKFKNRLVNILPYESSRVCLQPIRGTYVVLLEMGAESLFTLVASFRSGGQRLHQRQLHRRVPLPQRVRRHAGAAGGDRGGLLADALGTQLHHHRHADQAAGDGQGEMQLLVRGDLTK